MKPVYLSLIALGTLAAALSHADDTLTGTFGWTVGTLQTQVTVASTATQSIPVLVNGVGANYTVQIASPAGTVFYQGAQVAILTAGSLPFSNATANTSVYASIGQQYNNGIEVGLDATKKTKNNVAFVGAGVYEIASAAFSLGGFSFNNGLTLRFYGTTARCLPISYTFTTGTSKTITGTVGFAAFGSHNVYATFLGIGNKGTALGTGGTKNVAFEGVYSGATGVTASSKLPFAQLAIGAGSYDVPVIAQ